MSTHNDWFRSNIRDRLIDPTFDLALEINPYPFEEMSFREAADYTARLIYSKHKKIYVSLSGGADSEYTLRSFHRNNIPVIPIIVDTSGNKQELMYAYKCCEELEYPPKIIEVKDDLFLMTYYNIVNWICGYGIYSVPSIIACKYARDMKGVLVIGEHVIDTDKNKNTIRPGANEWDFYNECFVGEEHTIPFFNYTAELAYALVKAISDEPLNVFKSKTYGTELRPIMKYEFGDKFNLVRNVIDRSRKFNPNPHVDLNHIADTLEKYIIIR